MPDPTPTMKKVSSFIHKDDAGCEGPVIMKKRSFAHRPEPYCEKCGFLLDEDRSDVLGLCGMMTMILGFLMIIMLPIFLLMRGDSPFIGVVVGGVMIVSGFLVMVVDTWIVIGRLETRRGTTER
jgi:hypothetical protein